MSRSYRKNLVFPICCSQGQKWWKQSYNRSYRRQSKACLKQYLYDEDIDTNIGSIYKQHYADIWASPSDGKWRIDRLNLKEFMLSRNEQCRYCTYESYLADFKRQYVSK